VIHTLSHAVYATTGIFEKVFAKEVTADKVHAEALCVGETCVTEEQLKALLANEQTGASAGTGASSTSASSNTSTSATSTSSSPSGAAQATTTPDMIGPIFTLYGANPAHIDIGATYSDLGATVTDNVDQNLGYKVSLDSATSTDPSELMLDTSVAGTHTTVYSATDQAGNIGIATRTVVVGNAGPPVTDEQATTTPSN
jgi:hypothetical protein